MAYIVPNPVRAALYRQAEEWRCSSARDHLAGAASHACLDLDLWKQFYAAGQWRTGLAAGITDEAWIRRFRTPSHRGYALAEGEFIDRIETSANWRLRPGKPGPLRCRLRMANPGAPALLAAKAA